MLCFMGHSPEPGDPSGDRGVTTTLLEGCPGVHVHPQKDTRSEREESASHGTHEGFEHADPPGGAQGTHTAVGLILPGQFPKC